MKCLQEEKYFLCQKFSTLPMGVYLTCVDKSLGFSRSLVFQTGSLDFPCVIVSLWLINSSLLEQSTTSKHPMWQVRFDCESVLDEALSMSAAWMMWSRRNSSFFFLDCQGAEETKQKEDMQICVVYDCFPSQSCSMQWSCEASLLGS